MKPLTIALLMFSLAFSQGILAKTPHVYLRADQIAEWREHQTPKCPQHDASKVILAFLTLIEPLTKRTYFDDWTFVIIFSQDSKTDGMQLKHTKEGDRDVIYAIIPQCPNENPKGSEEALKEEIYSQLEKIEKSRFESFYSASEIASVIARKQVGEITNPTLSEKDILEFLEKKTPPSHNTTIFVEAKYAQSIKDPSPLDSQYPLVSSMSKCNTPLC